MIRSEDLETLKHQTARNMKENITNIMSRITKWLTLAVAVLLVNQSAHALIVYNNSTIRQTNNLGDSLYFAQSGYEFGDEVVLSPATNAYLTNFTFEYYGTGLAGATVTLRIYGNDAVYGTNFFAPGTELYDSGAVSLPNGSSGGFGTVQFTKANSGFAVPVLGSFTWTVEFGGIGGGTAGLALYNPPSVGSDYNEYWELSGAGSTWVYRAAAPGSGLTSINFGALAEAQNGETTAPGIAIVSPGDKSSTYAGVISVTGTAKDDSGIAQVWYRVNTGAYRPATTLAAGLLGNTNWTASATLKIGANTFNVMGMDQNGNTKSAARAFTYIVTNTLTVTFSQGAGSGTVRPAWTTTNLMIGKSYTMEVIPTKAGLINTFWYSNTVATSTTSTQTYSSPKFTFTMETNMTLVINCMTNRFIAEAGEYNGLFDAGGISQNSAGFVTLKTDAKRAFSGKIHVAGEALGISGLFDLAGNANAIVGATVTSGSSKLVFSKKQVLTNSVRLSMLFDGSKTVTGTVSNNLTGVVSALTADKYVWATNNPATNYSGIYTLAIPSALSNPNGPSGYGCATVIINTNGLITMKGSTADGGKMEQKVKLSKDGIWPCFAANGADGNTNKLFKGSVYGWLTVAENTDPTSGRVSGSLTWIRTSFPTNEYYPIGFTNASAPVANKYVNGKNGAGKWTNAVVALGGSLQPGPSGSPGSLVLTGSSVPLVVPVAVTSYTNGALKANILIPTKPPYETSFMLTAGAGNVNGSFINPSFGAKTKFTGVALQDENRVYGFFNSTNGYQSGKYIIQP